MAAASDEEAATPRPVILGSILLNFTNACYIPHASQPFLKGRVSSGMHCAGIQYVIVEIHRLRRGCNYPAWRKQCSQLGVAARQ